MDAGERATFAVIEEVAARLAAERLTPDDLSALRRLAKSAIPKSMVNVVQVYRGGAWFSLRWVLVHMIEEYARHNGHADLIRERIDGATGQ